jgi:hypothetical protein
VQWAIMISLVMVFLAMITNVIAMQYGHGAIRAAVDEAARFGASLGNDTTLCEAKAEQVLRGPGGLLRGRLGDGVVVQCTESGGVMTATATGAFEWWAGGLPDVSFTLIGEAVVEEAP